MKLWQKKTIKSILGDHKKIIKKALGQNYLLDHNILLKISEIVREYPSEHTVVEIGPGLGGLTQTFLEENKNSLIAVEIDPASCSILQDIFFKQNHFPEEWKQRFQLFNQNIRDFDLARHARPPYIFIGNLPYNVATFIIIEVLERYQNNISGGVFMIQKEVAERLAALPGDPEYSLITVIASASAQLKKIAHIPPASFYPPPKVDSTLIHVIPHKQNPFESPKHYLIFKIIAKAAFRHRRKQIVNSVKLALEKSEHLLTTSDEDKKDFHLDFKQVEKVLTDYKQKRAEDLSPKEYIELAREIYRNKN